MPIDPPVNPSPALSAWAVRLQFFIAGVVFATWGVQIPAVKLHFGLSEQSLALAMLAGGVGAVLTLTQAGRIVGRHGARRAAVASGVLWAASIGLLFTTRSYSALLLMMVLFGVAASLFDVAINASGSDLERISGRSWMSGFHGMFSLGGMVGAFIGSALLARGIAPFVQVVCIALVSAAAVAAAGLGMLRTVAGHSADAPSGFALPRGVLALLGTLAALGLIAEGAMYDWSVLYMKQQLGSEPGFAALAYASFSAAMAAARFCGDWVRERVRPARLLSGSAALSAGAMAIVLWVGDPHVALVGFALAGLGFANVVPVLFSAGAKVDANPAHGIAVVASVGYFGMMIGPPLIGVIAEHASLTLGLASVVVFAAVLALASPRALREPSN